MKAKLFWISGLIIAVGIGTSFVFFKNESVPFKMNVEMETVRSPEVDDVSGTDSFDSANKIKNYEVGGITLDEDKKIPPAPPVNIEISKEGKSITLSWEGKNQDYTGITSYQVYRQCLTKGWKNINSITGYSCKNRYCIYKVSDLPISLNGNTCMYSISVIDVYGNEGRKSKSVSFQSVQ